MGENNYHVVTQSTVSLIISTPLCDFVLERRFNKRINIGDLKGRLELLIGASPVTMRLQLFSNEAGGASPVAILDDDAALLGSYPVEDGMRIHVIDEATMSKTQISSEPKFELTDVEYAKRNDTVRAFLVRNKLGKYAATDSSCGNGDPKAETPSSEDEPESVDPSLVVGSRCQVTVQGQLSKRGQIRYVGLTHFKPGLWVGVAYDEPVGKHDGSIDSHKYFDCEAKYGAFVRPQFVVAGDFPEEDIDDLLDEI